MVWKEMFSLLVILGSLARAHISINQRGRSPPSFILPSTCPSKHSFDPALSWFRELSWQKNQLYKNNPPGRAGPIWIGWLRLSLNYIYHLRVSPFFLTQNEMYKQTYYWQTRNKGSKDILNGASPWNHNLLLLETFKKIFSDCKAFQEIID